MMIIVMMAISINITKTIRKQERVKKRKKIDHHPHRHIIMTYTSS